MKTLIAACLLLALASSAHAVEIDQAWRDNYYLCLSDDESPAHAKACAASRKVEKQIHQQGMRDYREGLCYRARPYSDNSPEHWLWERGWNAQQTEKQGKRNDEHCFLGRDR